MTDVEQKILNAIYTVADDESLSEHEALLVIMAIVEDRLAQSGFFPEHNELN